MADDISYIHSNKIAKFGRQYYDKYGVVYIGQRDGRLKKEVVTQEQVTKTVTSVTPVTPSDVVISTDFLSPLLLMGG